MTRIKIIKVEKESYIIWRIINIYCDFRFDLLENLFNII